LNRAGIAGFVFFDVADDIMGSTDNELNFYLNVSFIDLINNSGDEFLFTIIRLIVNNGYSVLSLPCTNIHIHLAFLYSADNLRPVYILIPTVSTDHFPIQASGHLEQFDIFTLWKQLWTIPLIKILF